MDNQDAYNQWAATYNDVRNLTRDLESEAKKEVLSGISFDAVLELGCGTGKNTAWLSQNATSITSVDFSEQMLSKAREVVSSEKVNFVQADINLPWRFAEGKQFNLITCSLVLEHIAELEPVFRKAVEALSPGGHFYIGELHPFKQYQGSKAKFEKDDDTHILDCFTHHVSDFTGLAVKFGFAIVDLQEWFDEGDKEAVPRILTLLLKKH